MNDLALLLDLLETQKIQSYWYARRFLSGVNSVTEMEGWTPGKKSAIIVTDALFSE